MARKRTNVRRLLIVCYGCRHFQLSSLQEYFRCGRISYKGYRSGIGFEIMRVPARCERMTEHATLRALRGL